MKKLHLVAMVAIFLSANTYAGEHTISFSSRAGWIYKDNDPTKTATSNSSSFNVDYLRTAFAGTLTPSVKYLVTSDLLSANGTIDAIDGTSSFIDEAYVAKTFSFGTSIIVGKKAVVIGGREYDYGNFDRYSTSYFYQATPSNQVGLTFSHEVAGQTFVGQYFNGNKDNGHGGTINAQSKFGWSLGWYGNIADGLIKPIFAYTVIPEAGGTNGGLTSLNTATTSSHRVNKGNDIFLALGVQFNFPLDVSVDADFNQLIEKDAAGTTALKKQLKTNSIIGLIRHSGERFSPFVKLISDIRKSDSIKTNTRLAYDVGVEFKEIKDDSVRYHVIYSGANVKDGINATEIKSSPKSIMAGIKFDASILK